MATTGNGMMFKKNSNIILSNSWIIESLSPRAQEYDPTRAVDWI